MFCSGIEHLEQRRRRIAAEVVAELVDLVEHEHRVAGLGAAQALDDLAGHRADVGAAVAADLGFVAHAAERHAHELAAHRLRDGPRQRGLADAGRADETQDRALQRRVELAHGEELEDAVLDLLEPGVLVVEHLLVRARSILSSDRFCHGSIAIQSRYVATRCIRGRRGHLRQASSSRIASFITPSGSPAASSFSFTPRRPWSARRPRRAPSGSP